MGGLAAPRLGERNVQALRKSFKAAYPTEICNDHTMGCEMYLAIVGEMKKPEKGLAWTPWHKIVNEHDFKRLTLIRGIKRDCAGNAQAQSGYDALAHMWSDQPIEHDPVTQVGQRLYCKVSQMRRNSWAAMQLCHLSFYKEFDALFEHLAFSQWHDRSSGMRLPTGPEIMWADEEIHRRMFQLCNDDARWTFDHVLYEFTEVRKDLEHLLQCRPMALAQPNPSERPRASKGGGKPGSSWDAPAPAPNDSSGRGWGGK